MISRYLTEIVPSKLTPAMRASLAHALESDPILQRGTAAFLAASAAVEAKYPTPCADRTRELVALAQENLAAERLIQRCAASLVAVYRGWTHRKPWATEERFAQAAREARTTATLLFGMDLVTDGPGATVIPFPGGPR